MNYPEFSQLIENWYHANRRDLPWRISPEPYNVWLAEIVFQQTRIAQGMGHYMRLLKRFPNVGELAVAKQDEVLKFWEGLGYYTRARNLHKAAQMIHARGSFPGDYATWLSVPGVGPYTAAAIASVCFDEKVSVVDGNVMRVLSRVILSGADLRLPETQANLKSVADTLIQHAIHPGDLNQGVMEVGALICKPRNPDCYACPVSHMCALYIKGADPAKYPYKSKAPEKRVRHLHFAFASGSNTVLLRQRNAKDIWRGLYQLPMIEGSKPPFGQNAKLIENAQHILTHQKINYYIWDVKEWSELEIGVRENYIHFNKCSVLPALPGPLKKFMDNAC
jgi:A/G-specific adenine glycosylase